MKPISFILSCCAVVFITVLVGPGAVLGADATSSAAKVCPGLNYQGDKCECKPGAKCEKCPCSPCVGGEKCACIKAVRDASGTITGQIAVVRTKVKTTGSKSDKDVVVYLEKVGTNDFPPPMKNPRMDQKGLVFLPHVIAVQRGATVEFLNNDNDKHNVYFFDDKSGKTKDLGTWQPGESRNHVFAKHHEIVKKPGKNGRPDTMIVLCKLHLEMAAYVIILDNPFFTIAAIDGETQKAKFTLKNVPPGKYKLNVWHKKLRLKEGVADIVVEQGKSTKIDLEITKEKYAKK